MPAMLVKRLRPLRTDLSLQIFLGLALGVFVGLFFGEPAAGLQPLADAYLRLMQMSVLPYLVLVLVVGFGQLDMRWARRLGLHAAGMMLLVWLVVAGVVTVMSFAYPPFENASFFSQSMVEPKKSLSLVELYFTSNLFHSLANDVVPPVVLFSSLLGVFLIGLEGREKVLEGLRTLTLAIERIHRFVIRLTPIGVFAIGAVTAGTMTPATFVRLEAYFVVFAAASLLLTFWILPLLVTALTPLRYREVLGASRDALLTAFMVNNAFVVLPLLVERSRELLHRRGLVDREGATAADVLVPILFNFPNAGRLLSLLFLPFAAWLSGEALAVRDYPELFAVGIPSHFAKATVALPYLLDLLGLPQDLFALYVPTSILNGKFDSMVLAMNLLVYSLLGAAVMGGFLRVRRAAVGRAVLGIVLGLAVTVLAVRLLLGATLDVSEDKGEVLRRMHASRAVTSSIMHTELDLMAPGPLPRPRATARMRERGTLRVGYDPGNLPFSFVNADSELVGFDVELARRLALSLGVVPEFVPVQWPDVPTLLAEGTIDVMPGLWYRPFWFSSVRLSAPYYTGTMGLVVRDERRQEFADVEALRRSRGLRVGVPIDASQVAYSAARYFGDADVEFVPIEHREPFASEVQRDLDAYLIPAENGAAWTLLHPEYTVVIPQPHPVSIPVAFGLARDGGELLALVDEWVLFAQSEGMVRDAYDYWVLGRGAESTQRRWSILRDVLGWGR